MLSTASFGRREANTITIDFSAATYGIPIGGFDSPNSKATLQIGLRSIESTWVPMEKSFVSTIFCRKADRAQG
jgi:hypothetical protein